MHPTKTPSAVTELSRSCRDFVEKALGIALDDTPDTLPLLDHYLSQVADGASDVRVLVAAAAGAHFGEVVRNRYQCRWHAPEGDHGAWRIEFEQVFLWFNPIALALEAITQRELGDASFGLRDIDRPAVDGALAVLGSVSEEDFFKLSTRFEVLEAVVERLIAAQGAREEGDEEGEHFGSELYEAVASSKLAMN